MRAPTSKCKQTSKPQLGFLMGINLLQFAATKLTLDLLFIHRENLRLPFKMPFFHLNVDLQPTKCLKHHHTVMSYQPTQEKIDRLTWMHTTYTNS